MAKQSVPALTPQCQRRPRQGPQRSGQGAQAPCCGRGSPEGGPGGHALPAGVRRALGVLGADVGLYFSSSWPQIPRRHQIHRQRR